MPSRARGAWAKRAWAILAGSAALLGARFAHAEPATDSPAPAPVSGKEPLEPPPVPNWWLRLRIAVGGPISSDQETLLNLEGYGGARLALSLGVARKLTDHVGIGALALYGWRSADTEDDERNGSETVVGIAPTYEEELVVLGVEVPLSYGLGRKRSAVVFLTPFAGVGFAKAEFDDQGDWQTGPAFGVGTGMFFPKVYFGFSFGAEWVPLPAPGEAGGHNDFGMIYFALIGGADVG